MLHECTLNRKKYRYDIGGCNQAVYVYDTVKRGAPERPQKKTAIVTVPNDTGWEKVAAAALRAQDKTKKKLKAA